MKKSLPKFEHIDHTADVGLKIYASNLAELFANAALGLFDIIANLEKVVPKKARSVQVEADERETLLVRWLSELNYLFFTEREIYKEFDIQKIDDKHVAATVRGQKLDYDRHEIYTEVKAVTYHKLYIRETSRGLEAQVIFDL